MGVRPSNGHEEPLALQPVATYPMRHIRMTTVKVTAIAAIVPLLACCASTGVYNMTDVWCAEHLTASAAQCPERRERVADHQQRMAANEVRSSE